MSGNNKSNIALLTEYDGTAFCGWQKQPRDRTVQQVLEAALRDITGEPDICLNGCSRTDAGVHARGHVSNFRTNTAIPTAKLPLALNTRLPDDVAVKAASVVAPDFHARFAARSKLYSYTFWHSVSRPVIERDRSAHVKGNFDLDAVASAMPHLLGEHDFSAMMDAGDSSRSSFRCIETLSISAVGPEIKLYVRGNGFLYHMVRIVAGTLLYVAQGKIAPDAIPQIISGRDRREAGKTMPACGLCLENVYYSQQLFAGEQNRTDEKRDYHVQYALE